jgi:hypothetical protein
MRQHDGSRTRLNGYVGLIKRRLLHIPSSLPISKRDQWMGRKGCNHSLRCYSLTSSPRLIFCESLSMIPNVGWIAFCPSNSLRPYVTLVCRTSQPHTTQIVARNNQLFLPPPGAWSRRILARYSTQTLSYTKKLRS